MKKYTEKDIEAMLSKTEKTPPSFDKTVRLPITPVFKRRKRIVPIIIAATLAVTVVASSLIMLMRNEEISVSNPDVSNFSEYSSNSVDTDNSTVQGESSYTFPDESDEERSTAATSSEPESEFVSELVSEEYLQVIYPTNSDFYVGQGLQATQTIDEYFAKNPLKHLGTRDSLSIYKREVLTTEQRKYIVQLFAQELDIALGFDEELFKITGDCRGISENGMFALNVGAYGDWYFSVKDENYKLVALGPDKNDFAYSAKRFIESHIAVFGEGDYYYTVEGQGSKYTVLVADRSETDTVIKRMPKFTFSYEMLYYGVYSLKYVEHSENGVSIGDFETAPYDEALKSLFNDGFYASHGFTFEDTDEYAMLGYDVRYLKTNYEELVCPFYAFIIRLNPQSENSETRTLFVPAIKKQHLAGSNDFE